MRQIKAKLPGNLQKMLASLQNSLAHEFDPRSAMEVSPEERLAKFEESVGGAWFQEIPVQFPVTSWSTWGCQRGLRRIRSAIRFVSASRTLWWRKCLCPRTIPSAPNESHARPGYYEAYIIGRMSCWLTCARTPIERITPNGIKTSDAEYAFDVIIFATGYDGITGSLTRIDIRGEGGQTIKDKFALGPRTYMGLQSAGFPNLFTLNQASRVRKPTPEAPSGLWNG